MKPIQFASLLLLIISSTLNLSCKKFLEERPDRKLVVPKTIADLQSILDNARIHEQDPNSCERSSDNFYITSDNYDALFFQEDKNAYIWSGSYLLVPGALNEWGYMYQNIFLANSVLEAYEDIQIADADADDAASVKGMALFVRGRALYNALAQWAKAYDESTADQDLGVSLRKTPNFTDATTRATNRQCYDQVLEDLKESGELLPVTSIHPVRPSKAAAYAMLARVYLSMRKYDSAYLYADKSLALKSDLLDFNDITNTAITYPMTRFNKEVIYDSWMMPSPLLNIPRSKTDSILFQSYAANDLRRSVYFLVGTDGAAGFRASYSGSNTGFSGLATDEVYLIRAECLARKGNTVPAMNDLNLLLAKRWKAGTFNPFTANNPEEALEIILRERRKELLLRGLRWTDIKRLNKEGYNIIPKRIVHGQEYTLTPNERRYALPIPEDVIAMTGMQQN